MVHFAQLCRCSACNPGFGVGGTSVKLMFFVPTNNDGIGSRESWEIHSELVVFRFYPHVIS